MSLSHTHTHSLSLPLSLSRYLYRAPVTQKPSRTACWVRVLPHVGVCVQAQTRSLVRAAWEPDRRWLGRVFVGQGGASRSTPASPPAR
eukprot:4131740-Alexandrium_andersonii.AAC.1